MSVEQRERLESRLRQLPFDLAGDIEEQRHLFDGMMSSQPPPADVIVTSAVLGTVPTAEITVAGAEPRHVVLYFHGGTYALGSAAGAADLASQIGRRTDATVISVDYRLAPEHPHPAAVDDAVTAYGALLHRGIAPSRIVVAGESAGAGLAVAALVAARDRGLPMPAAAFLMSPWADLTQSGATMDSKREIDPMLTREGLAVRAADYAGSHDPASSMTPYALHDEPPPLTSASPLMSPRRCPTFSKPFTPCSTRAPPRSTAPAGSSWGTSRPPNRSPPADLPGETHVQFDRYRRRPRCRGRFGRSRAGGPTQ